MLYSWLPFITTCGFSGNTLEMKYIIHLLYILCICILLVGVRGLSTVQSSNKSIKVTQWPNIHSIKQRRAYKIIGSCQCTNTRQFVSPSCHCPRYFILMLALFRTNIPLLNTKYKWQSCAHLI